MSGDTGANPVIKQGNMLVYSTGVQPPKTAEDFEDVCHIIYSVVFDDPLATKNGRSGQQQNGVDVFANWKNKRYGIQCKKKSFGQLTVKIITDEVKAADEGTVRIEQLIIATTAPNDAKLIAHAAQLSDARAAEGKFTVALAFWDTLETYIRRFPDLQSQLAPQMAGGAIFEFDKKLDQALAQFTSHALAASSPGNGPAPLIPDARADSVNKFIDGQLDGIKQQLIEGKASDALASLSRMGSTLEALDVHQRARWYIQRANSYWLLNDDQLAASDFDTAYELTPDDEKAAANHVRAALLRGMNEDALERATAHRQKFPASSSVLCAWLQAAHANSKTLRLRSDVPLEFKSNQDVLYTLGWLQLVDGNAVEAARLAEKACVTGAPNFEHKALLLMARVNDALEDGALASIGVVPKQKLIGVRSAVEALEPFDETLWTRQDKTVSQTVTSLGYALLILDQAERALGVLLQGASRFPNDEQLIRICLDTIVRHQGQDAAFDFGVNHFELLESDGLLVLAELAAQRGDIALLDSISAKIDQDVDGRALLTAYRWLANANLGKADEANVDLTLEWFTAQKSVPARVIALLVARRSKLTWVDEAMGDLIQSAEASSDTGCILMVAKLCASFDRHSDVIALLADKLPHGYVSEHHTILFEAYIRTGLRKKALSMLKGLPESAMSDPHIRSLAVELAQDANDWNQLSELSQLQLNAHADRADAWIFRAVVLLRQKRLGDARKLLKEDIPLDVSGSLRSQAQLARLEIERGIRARGFQRLYLTFRNALQNGEAGAIYLSHLFSIRPEWMPTTPEAVGEGSAITLRAEDGTTRIVVIDPLIPAVLSEAQGFFSPSSEFAKENLGKRSKDTISVSDSFGGKHHYEIVGIDSAYRHLGGRAQEMIHTAVAGTGPLTSISIPQDENGNLDMSSIVSMLKSRKEQIQQAISTYAQNPLPLGSIAKLIGTPAAVLASDWPHDFGHKLYVCSGSQEERTETYRKLESWEGPVVVDLSAINELVASGAEQSLGQFSEVYISSSAEGTLSGLINNIEDDRSRGHAYEEDGRISIVEYSKSYRESQLVHLNLVRACIDKYCQVVPAWGVEEPPEHLAELGSLLDQESFDALLLCLERDAILLTVDGRLREAAGAIAEISSAWPQLFCGLAVARKQCDPAAYHELVFFSLTRHRTHVSVAPGDILWAFTRQPAVRRTYITSMLRYLSDASVEIGSAIRVVVDVIKYMAIRGGSIAAVAATIQAFAAPFFMRPGVDTESMEAAFNLSFHFFIEGVFSLKGSHPFETAVVGAEEKKWRRALVSAVRRARLAANSHSLDDLGELAARVGACYATAKPSFRFF
ncbi:tetratricopeptide repeat protein [Cupriavidus pauculus]|uniref:tetratricopeptide repeat protein n=1 Tax=Cupriavidus pauculus TaxID=82633 RepID=UPI003857AB65